MIGNGGADCAAGGNKSDYDNYVMNLHANIIRIEKRMNDMQGHQQKMEKMMDLMQERLGKLAFEVSFMQEQCEKLEDRLMMFPAKAADDLHAVATGVEKQQQGMPSASTHVEEQHQETPSASTRDEEQHQQTPSTSARDEEKHQQTLSTSTPEEEQHQETASTLDKEQHQQTPPMSSRGEEQHEEQHQQTPLTSAPVEEEAQKRSWTSAPVDQQHENMSGGDSEQKVHSTWYGERGKKVENEQIMKAQWCLDQGEHAISPNFCRDDRKLGPPTTASDFFTSIASNGFPRFSRAGWDKLGDHKEAKYQFWHDGQENTYRARIVCQRCKALFTGKNKDEEHGKRTDAAFLAMFFLNAEPAG